MEHSHKDCSHCSHGSGTGKNCISLVPIFSSLTDEENNEIAAITTDREFKKGEVIYLAGDRGGRLYVIHQGKVKVSKISETGKEQIIRILGAGDFLGELSLFTHSPLDNNAEALEHTTVCIIEGSKLNSIIGRNPAIAVKILEEMSKRLRNAENLIESLGLQDVEQRVADTLLRLSDGKREIKLDISKKDLAAHIGISQETLSRKLSSFEESGWIKQTGHRKITILDRESLALICGDENKNEDRPNARRT